MNKNGVSKLFLYPLTYILFFIGGVIVTLEFSALPIPVLVTFLVISFILIYFKLERYAALIVLFVLGCAYTLLFICLVNQQFPSGCYVGYISSPINKYTDERARYVFSFDSARVVIESEYNGSLGYGDKLEVCLSDIYLKNIEAGATNYYLSNYLTNKVYKDPPVKYQDKGKGLKRSLFDLANFLEGRFYRLWPGNKGTLAKGLILGGSQNFTDELKNALKSSGTSHLTAVSGYNIAIITVVIFNLLRFVSKKIAFITTGIILICFVFITGLAPSVIRAALMGGAYLLSKMLGRPKMTMHFLSLAGFIMVLSNPFIVYNIGFLLSFGATYGLIFTGDLLGRISFGARDFKSIVLSTLGETTVAQIFVMPILIYYFGQVSVVSPIANLFILPFIPMVMFLEFIAIILSFINFYLGIFFAKLVEPFLNYIIFIIKFFGSSDHAIVEIGRVNFWLVAVLYVIFYITLKLIYKKINLRRIIS